MTLPQSSLPQSSVSQSSSTRSLPQEVDTLVIGGGVMGCSTLYHLAKFGASDAILLEKSKLTSGTTWHSAAQVRQLRSTRNLTRLIQYSRKLYRELEAETGQSTGWLQTGSLSIATSKDRLTHIRRQASLAKAYGVSVEELAPADVTAMWPLMNVSDVIGAVYAVEDGRVNPSDLCLALSKGARAHGAQIFEQTPVLGLVLENDRVVGVNTSQGIIRCRRVALCAGLWSRELAMTAGVDVPLYPCEHYYLLTRPMNGITQHLPTLSDHDGHLYLRDEVGGLLVGCFEPQAKVISPQSLGEDFAFSLLPEDWDHFEPMMKNALHRIPALAGAQVRTLLNGPESFTPDGVFFLGESAKRRGLYLACGMNSVGIATGGGAGFALARTMIDGAPPFYLGDAHADRFHACENDEAVLRDRVPEVLGKHYEIAYPGRQWSTSRWLRRPPLAQLWQSHGAQFGQFYGWERPLYFNAPASASLSFDRPPWFGNVEQEVLNAHERSALFDQSTLGKIRVRGDHAQTFLNRICANDMARPPGRIIYTSLLNRRGGIECDMTALRLSHDEYWLYTGTGSIDRDIAWLRQHKLPRESLEIVDQSETFAVLALMGPETPALARLFGADWLLDVGYYQHAAGPLFATSVRAARLSYVGERGWEITCNADHAETIATRLIAAGVRPAGLYAQTSMRIEKRFLAMGADIDADTSPIEAGLGFAVTNQGEFVGSASQRDNEDSHRSLLVSICLDDATANPLGDEPIYHDGDSVGQATSAAFGYRVGRPILLGYIERSILHHRGQVKVEVDIAGELKSGLASIDAAFDPRGLRMKF